jgi:hypothetical protein
MLVWWLQKVLSCSGAKRCKKLKKKKKKGKAGSSLGFDGVERIRGIYVMRGRFCSRSVEEEKVLHVVPQV